METRGILHLFLAVCLILVASACTPEQPTQEASTTTPPLPTNAAPVVSTVSPAEGRIPAIASVDWDAGERIIHVGIGPWPTAWSEWTMILDGKELSTVDDAGAVVIRPDAPLEQPPTGLIIGTLPWVSGLEEVDFPCCGTLQFDIPGMGLTNEVEYNLQANGCATASTKVCKSEWTEHDGDLILKGNEQLVIEGDKYIQRGNIYVRDSATLVIKNSELMMERGSIPTIHIYIFVEPAATLIIDRSKVYPGPISGGLACVINHGTTSIIDSPTSIHYFDMSEGATLTMENSSMIFEIGGLLQVTGGKTNLTNATIGALGLYVPAGAHLEADGLQSGATFDHWRIQDLIPEADYELTFDHVTLLEDDFTGEYEHGPYERGWIFFLDADSLVRLSNSELRKVFIDVRYDTVEFRNLKIGEPSDLAYRDILLEDVIVQGQWPFIITESKVTIIDSNYLFLQPSGQSVINLVNSHIVEFIPRDFTGTINFENGLWTNAGEILGGVDYHSNSNHFKITGSLEIGDELRTNLQWRNAQVTREFDVEVVNALGNPVAAAVIKINGQEYVTGADGRTKFTLVFDDANYNQEISMEVWISGENVQQAGIDFFVKTPILVVLPTQ